MIQQVPKPSALAARHRLKQAAPQERICSHSGAPGLGVTREMTATTVGARNSRVRSVSSRAAEGVSFSSARHAFRSTRPKAARASPSKTMKRQGSSFLWSGTRAAAVRIVSSCCGAGPGLGRAWPPSSTGASTAARGCPGSWVALRSCRTGGLPSKALAKPTLPRVQWGGLGCKHGRMASAMWNDHRGRGCGAFWHVRALLALAAPSAARAQEPASVIIVFDGSGSMAGNIEGVRGSKVVLARDAVRRALDKVGPQDARGPRRLRPSARRLRRRGAAAAARAARCRSAWATAWRR